MDALDRYITGVNDDGCEGCCDTGHVTIHAERDDGESYETSIPCPECTQHKRFTLTRTDEAGFRASVPRTVGGLDILAVSRFSPGGEGFYASAVAVASGDPGGFSTHLVVYNDERDRWDLMIGHYLFATRDEADRDAAERLHWSRLP